MKGPRPLPIAIHRMNGNPSKKNLGKMEAETPKARVSVPTPPATLDAVAKKEWKRITGELLKMGIIAQCDEEILETYCVEYSIKRSVMMIIKNRHLIPDIADKDEREDAEHELKRALAVFRKVETVMFRLYGELGLSPSARSRIRVIDSSALAPQESKFSKFA